MLPVVTMAGVPSPHPPEQLIGALIPASLPSRRPPPLPTVELPPPPTVCAKDPVALSIGRVDRSGRIPAAAAVAALAWPPGTCLRLYVRRRRIVLHADASGLAPAAVACRAQIALPVAVRRLCGINDGSTVVLAALVSQRLLVIHPAAEVVRLLRRSHTQILGGHRRG